MISAESILQLEELVDTCSQGKELTNGQTRSMLTILATCMLSGSNQVATKKDFKLGEEELQKLHNN